LTWVNKPREAFRLTVVIATAAFSLLATRVFALPTEPPKVQTVTELKAAVANIVDKDHVPGVGIAVVSKDKLIWAGGVGRADLATGRNADDDTMFRIA
jgi:CubicO group peptidase (beta-lactamase class C family)